ncbi:MAG: GyrI-like domain-containing protein [Chitinophagaceae bacterium]
MEKLDLAKQYKAYYTAARKPELVQLEQANYLSITGQGDPSAPSFSISVQALYSVAYTIKSMCKSRGKDFAVAKLEGLWSFDEEKYKAVSMTDAPKKIPRSEWQYRLLIRMPDFVTAGQITIAREGVATKKQLPDALRTESFILPARQVVQMLHTGPFDTEPETLQLMLGFIQKNNFQRDGLHHEVYLSDFRKTAPEKLKTILREPVKRSE